jgi:3-oxoacyl-[acyl-carrier-protein] synthase III
VKTESPRTRIIAVRSFLPTSILDNQQLSAESGWTADEIFSKTGIRQRHIAGQDECTSDLAAGAVRRILDEANIPTDAIEFLVLCTQTPDHILPSTACLVQAKLGLPHSCAAFDINLGCSGYIYGLGIADSFIRSRLFQRGIVVTADTYTKYIHAADRSIRTIFGDGATATLVEAHAGSGLAWFSFGTDGSGAKNLIIPAGGTRLPCTAATKESTGDKSGNQRTPENLCMNGPEIFTFTLKRVPEVISQTLKSAGMMLAEVDWFIFHQANGYMLEHLRKKLGISTDRVLSRLEDVGNTVSSSIPLVIEQASALGQFHPGQRVLLVGFGVGYSWGAVLWTIPAS